MNFPSGSLLIPILRLESINILATSLIFHFTLFFHSQPDALTELN